MLWRLLRLQDWVLFLGLPLLIAAVMLLFTLRYPFPTWPLYVGWGTVIVFILGGGRFLIKQASTHEQVKYISLHAIAVAWNAPEYRVPPLDFDEVVEEVLVKVQSHYPHAHESLIGCLVFFADKTCMMRDSGVMLVRWDTSVSKTDLAYAIGHRIVRICDPKVPPDQIYGRLVELGVL